MSERATTTRAPIGTAVCVALALCVTPVAAHGPEMDGQFDDWCFDDVPRNEDSARVLACDLGSEVVWWDAPADAVFGDLATAAVTRDADALYVALGFHEFLDPLMLPSIQVAIDVAPGGADAWLDPAAGLVVPGHCSGDDDRLCVTDEDCHFCALTVAYPGTPFERPQICGSTSFNDMCDPDLPGDVCDRAQTCVATTDPAGLAGAAAAPVVEPDYLLVYDIGAWLVGWCRHARLLRHDATAGWVQVPRADGPDSCGLDTWHFEIVIPPGVPEFMPDGVELAVPWQAFDCDGCAPFGPGDRFRFSVLMARDAIDLNFAPDGGVEDLPSEPDAGATTTTPTDCAGPDATPCELADASADAFVTVPAAGPGGRVAGLRLDPDGGDVALRWDPSCSEQDDDYAVYEGALGEWSGHSAVVCSTGGLREASVTPAAGDRFFLVVPRTAGAEGSYGLATAGQRAVAGGACVPQSLGGCALVP